MMKAKLSPQQSAPVDRKTVSDKTDLLAELSEESLSGVVASVSVECIRVCICAASGYEDK
jgi:bacteriocin leader peptide (microcyclamide/patellamide family)